MSLTSKTTLEWQTFNVIPNRVKCKGSIVIFGVLGSQTWWTIAGSTCLESSGMELMHKLLLYITRLVFCPGSNLPWSLTGSPEGDMVVMLLIRIVFDAYPELRPTLRPETSNVLDWSHHDLIAQGCKSREVPVESLFENPFPNRDSYVRKAFHGRRVVENQ